ncbi:MAG: hypothetical protein ABIH34_04095 [Nanoarchaeota archaeon]
MEKVQPEMKFRAGAISASIWNNSATNKEGNAASYKTVSLQRAYKDKSGEWKHTNSLRTSDLPKAMVVLNKAFEHIVLKGDDEE